MGTSIMRKLVIRERKKNRHQTIAVWIAACIATTLFTAVFSFAASCQAGLLAYAKDLSGDYDYVFYDVPREDADHIVNNRKVATAYQSIGLGYAKLSGSKNPDKPYMYLTAMDHVAMQKNALHLIKGRMPKNDHEILISRHMMTNGGVTYQIGDIISLDISKRTDKNGNELTQANSFRKGEKLKKKFCASFQVVGIVQRPNFGFEEWTAPGYSVITYLNQKGDHIPAKYTKRTDIYCRYTKEGLRDRAQTTADIVDVTLKPGVRKILFLKDERITNRQINDLMEQSPYRFYENWGLIRFERMDINQSAYHFLYLAVAVTTMIILAAAASCIGSSFAISIEEKRKSYGMLVSVGATPRQIRQSVYYEAFLTGRTAIPLGTVLGLLLSFGGIAVIKGLLQGQNTMQFLQIHVAWQTIIAGILLSAVTLVLSAHRPAKQAAKSSPVQTIRGQAKKSRRAKKRTITAAIAGCMALTVLVSYFMGIQTIVVRQSNHMFNDQANVSMRVQGSWEANRSAILQSTKEKSVTEAAILRTAAYVVNTKEVPYTKTHIRRNGAPDLKHETNAVIQVLAVGETAYRNYLKDLGLSYEKGKNGVIFYNAYAGYWNGKETTWKVTDYKTGDWIRGQFCHEAQREETTDLTDQVQIAAVTTKRPFGVDASQGYADSGTIIVSDAWLDAHDSLGGAEITVKYASTDPGTLAQALEKTYDFYPEEIKNRDLQKRENNMLLSVYGIVLYGFLLAVLLIGATNICNTVLTDLWQRRWEFVILRAVGMTPKQEKQMLAKEFFRYGKNGILTGLVIGGGGAALYDRIFAVDVHGMAWFSVAAAVIILVGLLLLFALLLAHHTNTSKGVNMYQ